VADDAPHFDVAIIGGGLVGTSLALMLSAQGRKVLLVEAQISRPAAARWDERCIALNAGSRRILEAIGVWARLEPETAAILSTHISERGRFGIARFDAAEAGLPALGYNTPLRAINDTLWQCARESGNVVVACPARVGGIQILKECARVQLESPEAALTRVQARLVIAADGARSAVRELLNIPCRTHDYGQSAIVTAIRTRHAHAGVAYERFLPGGPLAILPKPQDVQGPACSLVWTVPQEALDAQMLLTDAAFIAGAQAEFGERLGAFTALGARQAYPLTRVVSERIQAPRVLLIGNAAQSLHPVAAQGFNLGLRDAATAADLIHNADDPGGADVLAEYVRRRTPDRDRVSAFTDGLVRLFSNAVPGLRGVRHLGLLALELESPLRETVLNQNLGFGGRVPGMARRGA
jgi:2-octaprenyl-6-methoxyphenol hydroxylase